jgi:flavin reductase (DIM6/NTAB) family NADH-FMN oxidoreductase RutF
MEALDYMPHPLIIVTAGDPDKPGRRGGMTAAWACRVSWDPPLVAVAIAPERFTLELIREKGEFAINVVGPSLRDAAFGVFGSVSGRQMDKFEKSGAKMVKAKSVTAPALARARAGLARAFLPLWPACHCSGGPTGALSSSPPETRRRVSGSVPELHLVR